MIHRLAVCLFLCAIGFVPTVEAGSALNLLFTVFPNGNTYADRKTSVRLGEWYALVFLPTGSTGVEIAADCTVVDSTKGEIVKVLQSGTEEADSPICFQVDSDLVDSRYKGKGSWAVYLLDTRVYASDGTVSVSPNVDGKPVAVNASTNLYDIATKVTASSGPVFMYPASAATQVVTVVPTDAPVPEITSLVIKDAKAHITVSNTAPYLTYNLRRGATPSSIGGAPVAENPKTGVTGSQIELIAPASENCSFFRVNRN